MQQLDPKFQLSEDAMNEWGYALYRAGRGKESIEVYKLAVTVYPESWNLFDSLAEVYEGTGDKPLAIQHYRRSLELDAGNSNAVRHLKQLEVPH
jgi:D-alanyl-D-alanine-carboxypeptidase/D-alanyl-D-alanine-endopeptidase